MPYVCGTCEKSLVSEPACANLWHRLVVSFLAERVPYSTVIAALKRAAPGALGSMEKLDLE